MAKTIVGVNDPKAVKKFSASLYNDICRTAYWQKKFASKDESAPYPVQVLTDLESDKGDKIAYDLSIQLKGQPTEGDDVLLGQEESLSFYTDEVYIDQSRHAVDTGGAMTRKRTIHDMRMIAKARLTEYWTRVLDELHFMYASGARGANTDYVFPLSYSGFAGNALTAPDSEHLIYAGSATSKATLASTDKMSLKVIDKAKTEAEMMGGGTQSTPQIQPIMIDGEEHYVLVINPWQEYDLRQDATTGGWLDIQKALATNLGKDSKILKGGAGMHNNVIIHTHKALVRFSDYGAGANVAAARALFLGRQALAIAYGSAGSGQSRLSWTEESKDYGNNLGVACGMIVGIKKSTFNSKDFGVLAIDSAAAKPA